jgi:tryptophan halogenase
MTAPVADPLPRVCRVASVGVIGGGTAGYLTALALRRWFPDLAVTLVESSRIPIIGVGEATTPPLVGFLHQILGVDVDELYRDVQPTWKLGIHFEWGPAGGFHYPFSWGDLGDAHAHDGSIERASLGSMLMRARRTPLFRRDDGTIAAALQVVRYAYHLDNRRFVRFLTRLAARAGVVHRDAQLAEVELEDRGGEPVIEHLRTTDGDRLRFDFYVDCTGFRSVLLGGRLAVPFISYADSLYCDRAVVADVPHGGTIKPFTLAETMDHGWCWNIPMVEEDHRGYVFASAFCSEDQAIAELRAKNPGLGEPWSVRFRSGRHRDFWRGNLVAIGNSYGFVEPLESTAIHMVLIEITRLLHLLDRARAGTDDHRPEVVNRRIGDHWDYLRWFLALHYRFNRRLDTPFWQACRADVNIDGLAAEVEDFRAHGALSSRDVARPPDAIFGAGGLDIMLLGQQVPAPPAAPRCSAAAWARQCARRAGLVARSLLHHEALAELARRPAILHEAVSDGWVPALARAFHA